MSYRDSAATTKRRFDARWYWLLVIWLWFPFFFVGVFYGLFLKVFFNGTTAQQSVGLWLHGNFVHGNMLWLLVAVSALISGIFCLFMASDGFYRRVSNGTKQAAGVIAIVMAVVLAGSSSVFIYNIAVGDKREATYYAGSIVFYTPSLESTPASLSRLLDGSTPGDGQRCDRIGPADVPSCIKQGDLQDSWDSRIGSFAGAKIAIKRTSAAMAGVSLMEETVTYLNGYDGQDAGWSGILDGSGRRQPLGGVAEWSGRGISTQCFFRGDFAIDRAFNGERMNNLPNLLAATYPSLTYDRGDVWGYCDGEEPIVVIPVMTPLVYGLRTVTTTAGIITVRGDHGKVKLEHITDVAANDMIYPGPVYPMSLVAKQRQMANWGGGRGFKNQGSFGFEPTSSAVQAGNTSEYLLRDQNGRLVFVTPLTLAGSTSEIFVAYGLTYADEVHAGQLNQYSLYALADGDPRMLNIDDLDAKSRGDISRSTKFSTFLNTGGKLLEYTPVTGTQWRAYGERNERVELYMDVTANSTTKPAVVVLDDAAGDLTATPGTDTATNPGNTGQPAVNDCGADPSAMSDAELAGCLQVLADELSARAGTR